MNGNFTLSFHFNPGKGRSSHLDLFLQIPGRSELVHYWIHPDDYRSGHRWQLGQPHREKYMWYEGHISGNRGKIRRLKTGTFSTDAGGFPAETRVRLL